MTSARTSSDAGGTLRRFRPRSYRGTRAPLVVVRGNETTSSLCLQSSSAYTKMQHRHRSEEKKQTQTWLTIQAARRRRGGRDQRLLRKVHGSKDIGKPNSLSWIILVENAGKFAPINGSLTMRSPLNTFPLSGALTNSQENVPKQRSSMLSCRRKRLKSEGHASL